MLVKFHSDETVLNLNLAVSSLRDLTIRHLIGNWNKALSRLILACFGCIQLWLGLLKKLGVKIHVSWQEFSNLAGILKSCNHARKSVLPDMDFNMDFFHLRSRHTALYCLITANTRQNLEADDVVCVDVEFKKSYSRFIEVAGRGEKSERRRTRHKVLNCSKF